jgi:hypothetical protein
LQATVALPAERLQYDLDPTLEFARWPALDGHQRSVPNDSFVLSRAYEDNDPAAQLA